MSIFNFLGATFKKKVNTGETQFNNTLFNPTHPKDDHFNI